jgi:para-aminobenzoate synthetase component 1
MRALIEKLDQAHCPERLAAGLQDEPGLVLLHSSLAGAAGARYSFVTARPFLTFRSSGSRCELTSPNGVDLQFGDPWRVLDAWSSRFELPDEIDLPFPLGGCFGFWGYELKNFVEPRLPRHSTNDLELPDCHLGFYDSLVAFDHHLGATWIVATGLEPNGSRSQDRARRQLDFWLNRIAAVEPGGEAASPVGFRDSRELPPVASDHENNGLISSNLTRQQFIDRVDRVQRYIRAGDVYQVNLSQRLNTPFALQPWTLFQALRNISPAPFSAYLNCGEFQLASSSPELFLHLSGSKVQTRPIKGTRPRSSDPTRDAQLGYQLQTSPKDMAELVMIIDLLRNDLGKVCEFGSVNVPDLARLERFPQVQHLVSTVEGLLRPDVTHLGAMAACFPGGSITGAPKIRAMEIIDELEPACRGPYTGAIGYLGFNRESQAAMTIRTAVCKDAHAHFQVGAGLVADSDPESEYLETLAKARGFLEALRLCSPQYDRLSQWKIRA